MNMFTVNNRQSSKRFSSTLYSLSLIALMVALMVPSTADAQWSGDPKVNNLVTLSAFDQVNTGGTGDGNGGAIIVWQDRRNGTDFDIYAQHVNSIGTSQWTTNGVSICSADSDQINPTVISDGSGGAIITWQDKRSGNYDLYSQRINASGAKQWSPSTGAPVCVSVFQQSDIVMVSDGSGGALIGWEDYRSNAGPGLADIYAQKLNASGTPQWTVNGVGICTQAAAQHGPRIISDGNGGAFLSWYDLRAGNYDIYAQHITNIGGLIGTANGVAVCTMATDQTHSDITSDGAGGAIIVWEDFRSTTSIDIWVQRMSSALAIQWPVNGVVMNNNVAYDQINPKLVSDGIGGAIMTWEDFRTGITSDIYAQRVDSTGVVATGWNVNGITVSVASHNQSNPSIISDSSHGAIITWIDKRDSSTNKNTYDVYASRITGAFAFPWTANGVPIATADSTQTNPTTVMDGNGGAIIAWQDKRSGNFDIYASRVFKNGMTTLVVIGGTSPEGFTLEQNYPNPFNPVTAISYEIPETGHVSLKIFDSVGHEVATLVNTIQSSGKYTVSFNTVSGSVNLSSGVYFYRFESGKYTATKKLLLLK